MIALKSEQKDPILAFDVPYRFGTESNRLGMSAAQAFVALPRFFSGFALHQYLAVSSSLTFHGS